MKQMTEAELRKLLEVAFKLGYDTANTELASMEAEEWPVVLMANHINKVLESF